MNHELSSLTLEDISIDSDVLTQDWSNQVANNATVVQWNTLDSIPVNPLGSEYSTSTSNTGLTSSGTFGPYIYTTNTTGINSINPGNISIANTQFEHSGKMVMKGAEADIEINGKSMSAWMEKVEQRLNILTPNPDLEKDWDDLRRLGERYRKLEKKCQEKSQMWETLKKMPPPKL